MGFFIQKPGTLMQMALEEGAMNVSMRSLKRFTTLDALKYAEWTL